MLLGYAIYEMQRGDYSPRTIPRRSSARSCRRSRCPPSPTRNARLVRRRCAGGVYLLNVWASWCVSCREEHPLLNELARNKTVTLIGLNYKDKREDALAWLAGMGNPYELSFADTDGRLGIELGVYGVPETFVIDKEGIIRYKQSARLRRRRSSRSCCR